MNSVTRTIGDIGRSLLQALDSLGEGTMILWDALLGIFRGNVRARNRIIEQMSLVGIESLPIVLITVLFGGMVLGLHTAKQFVLYGAGQFVGSVVALSMARELAPTLTGIVVAARIGSAFAAELGSMKITNQIDAMRALAVNPVRYLVTPRLVAAMIMMPVLTIFANITGMLGGALVAINAGVSTQSFLNSARQYLEAYDVAGGLLKTMVFGAIITITACAVGLRTEGGASGVGRSTTSAVVWSIILLYGSNLLLSWMLYSFRP
jgi:phospholipid/cholesterol/gamma-HCH transport system permease protein